MACCGKLKMSSVNIYATLQLAGEAENSQNRITEITAAWSKHKDLTGVQCENGFVHGGWQCLSVVGLFCGKHPPGERQHVLISAALPIDHWINVMLHLITWLKALSWSLINILIPTWKITCQNRIPPWSFVFSADVDCFKFHVCPKYFFTNIKSHFLPICSTQIFPSHSTFTFVLFPSRFYFPQIGYKCTIIFRCIERVLAQSLAYWLLIFRGKRKINRGCCENRSNEAQFYKNT